MAFKRSGVQIPYPPLALGPFITLRCGQESFDLRKVFAAAILLLAVYYFPLGQIGADEAVNSKSPIWLPSYQEALQAARQTGKPLLVVFRCPH